MLNVLPEIMEGRKMFSVRQDNDMTRGKLNTCCSEGFSNNTFKVISLMSFSKFLGYSDSQATRLSVFRYSNIKQGLLSLAKNPRAHDVEEVPSL